MFGKVINLLFDRTAKTHAPAPLPNEPDGDLAYPWLNRVFEHLLRRRSIASRPGYTWGILHSAFLAKSLNIQRISAIELGVAGGNGLLAMEDIADAITQQLGVGIDVYGFDSAQGLPKPRDYRDTPNLWSAGAYPMNVAALRQRLRHAELLPGLVEQTIPQFIQRDIAPIGFVSFDLDLYSSTAVAMRLLEADPARLLPRVHCYFDDILGFTYGHHNGERLAIAEFNRDHAMRQVSEIYGLRYYLPPRHRDQPWSAKVFMAHILDHRRYNDWDGQVRHARLDLKEAA